MTDSSPNGYRQTLTRIHGVIVGLLVGGILPGCATHLCQSDLDEYYAAYGGRRARADMVHGRVGSVFDPAPELTVSDYVPHEVGQWQDPSSSDWKYSPHQPAVYQQPNPTTGPELVSPASGQVYASLGSPDADD